MSAPRTPAASTATHPGTRRLTSFFSLVALVAACSGSPAASPTSSTMTSAPTDSSTMTSAPTDSSTMTSAPTQPATAPPSATRTPTFTAPTVTVEPTQLPIEHRIAIRVVEGVGEYYDRQTGEKFVPRGNNYIRVSNQDGPGGTLQYHSTFNVGSYEPDRAEQALRRMHEDGYNIVRVFLNGCCAEASLGDPAGGLSEAYVANIVNFLNLAKANDLFVLISTDGPPAVGGYVEILDSTWSENFQGTSAQFLRTGGLRAEAQFWRDLILELTSQDAPLDVIFAYQLRNELYFDSNLPPLSLSSGIVTTANGATYDMSSQEDKQRIMDEGLVYWIDATRTEIRSLDPTALVTVGFFVPQKPHPSRIGDPRVIETRPAIWESSADFIDLHPYPGFELTLPQYVDNFGMPGMEAKPILMGEFGAARSSYATEAGAARALHDWQVESCDYGFDGWLLWTWDTDEQTDFYNGQTGDGLINRVLAPSNRPDPCQAGTFDFFEYNLALGTTARASRSLTDQPPSGAVDGSTNQWWGAGASAPQWIQVDLGRPSTIGLIRLVVTQSPAGDTRHEIWVGTARDRLYLLHTFAGRTVDDQVLEFSPDGPVENVRFIRVVTTESPSWVGWKEIEVLAP